MQVRGIQAAQQGEQHHWQNLDLTADQTTLLLCVQKNTTFCSFFAMSCGLLYMLWSRRPSSDVHTCLFSCLRAVMLPFLCTRTVLFITPQLTYIAVTVVTDYVHCCSHWILACGWYLIGESVRRCRADLMLLMTMLSVLFDAIVQVVGDVEGR